MCRWAQVRATPRFLKEVITLGRQQCFKCGEFHERGVPHICQPRRPRPDETLAPNAWRLRCDHCGEYVVLYQCACTDGAGAEE